MGHASFNPSEFSAWGGISHFVGTDASGNPLIAQDSGSFDNGTWSRTVERIDKNTGVVLGTYVSHVEALDDGAGHLTGYKIYEQDGAGQPLVISTLTKDFDLVRETSIGDNGNTISYTQAGIRIDIGADGQKTAYVPNIETGILVAANGDIVVPTTGGNITIHLADDPLAGGTCSANGRTISFTGGDALGSCTNGLMIQGQGQTQATDRLIDGAGQVTQLDYVINSGSAHGDWTLTGMSATTEIAPGYVDHQTDTNADGLLDTRKLITATGTNPLTTLQDLQSAEHLLTDLNAQNLLDPTYYQDFTQWSSDALVFGGSTLWTLGPGYSLSLDPIGAFYESRTPAIDTAPGIADKTPVLLNAANVGLTPAALAGLDANADGKLSGNELASLTLWSDLNQNGLLDANELQTPAQAGLGEITAADYAFYTAGNSQFAESADTTPDSHYRTLRDTDNIYNYQTPAGIHGSFIWTTSQIKINAGQPTYLIGTDGNDGFDAASFEQAYTNAGLYGAFNAALLTNFLGGDGNDTVGGSVRNDQIWGGTGDDVLLGYAGNDHIHGENGGDILVGQEGQDILNGGAGNDIMVGGLSNDSLWGGEGADEINGGEGEDRLYGEAGDDGLFGQVGDDILYGGDGNDLLVGFTGTNEIKQTLDPGETDNDHLYGGAGSDTLLGGLGNDYLDGGAGADIMEGGAGDDSYIVNSVNDIILEQPGAGHDTVTSSVNYLLNAHIEDLRLLDGLDINGSGNALDNRIVGNSRDNILDGITGADTMIGGAGNDTYYVDNSGDQTIEQAGEGVDTVQSTITTTLGANLENLILLDFTKPEHGLVDGQPILVYGYPKANELDYMQGDAVPNFTGTCALTSIANLLTQTGTPTAEGAVVQRAIDNNWTLTDPTLTDYQRGGSDFAQQQQVLDSYGLRNDLLIGNNPDGVANLIRSGRGVNIGVNGGALWDDANYVDDGGVNHVVTVTRGFKPQPVHSVQIPEAFIKKIRAVFKERNKPNDEVTRRLYKDFLRSRTASPQTGSVNQ